MTIYQMQECLLTILDMIITLLFIHCKEPLSSLILLYHYSTLNIHFIESHFKEKYSIII